MTKAKAEEAEDMSPAELQAALDRSVVIKIESYGEVVYEPGMSEAEIQAREQDVSYRHGGMERVRQAAIDNMADGIFTQAQADAHVKRHEEAAKAARAAVEFYDAQKRGGPGAA